MQINFPWPLWIKHWESILKWIPLIGDLKHAVKYKLVADWSKRREHYLVKEKGGGCINYLDSFDVNYNCQVNQAGACVSDEWPMKRKFSCHRHELRDVIKFYVNASQKVIKLLIQHPSQTFNEINIINNKSVNVGLLVGDWTKLREQLIQLHVLQFSKPYW